MRTMVLCGVLAFVAGSAPAADADLRTEYVSASVLASWSSDSETTPPQLAFGCSGEFLHGPLPGRIILDTILEQLAIMIAHIARDVVGEETGSPRTHGQEPWRSSPPALRDAASSKRYIRTLSRADVLIFSSATACRRKVFRCATMSGGPERDVRHRNAKRFDERAIANLAGLAVLLPDLMGLNLTTEAEKARAKCP
jgi:hypothetical protein